VRIGVTFVVIGLVQKTMLADSLGKIVDPIYQQALTGPVADGKGWLAMAFAFQVFFDFSGYSDIAIGLALIFGIVLPRNFDGPFRATSMVDFWQRWHMTLARFLRDYVFTPLSRLPIGDGRHRMTRALFAILLTMALCGLWHGAGWTFVLWGTLQGVAIVFAAVWSRYLKSPPALTGWAGTIGFFLLTIVLFRAHSLDAAWHVYESLASLPKEADGFRTIAVAAFCAIALPPTHVIATRLTERPNGYVPTALAAATILVLLQISKFNNYEFIYFQF
jgi:alginate O-acetyltransferase complex protein AlgI